MFMKKLVDIVIFKNLINLDKLYTYEVDEDIKPGSFVIVDFNDSLEIGLVLFSYKDEVRFKTKKVLKVVEELEPLTKLQINLGMWMKEFYILTYAKAFSIICDFTKISNLDYKYVLGDSVSDQEKEIFENYLSKHDKNLVKKFNTLIKEGKVIRQVNYEIAKVEENIYYKFLFDKDQALSLLRKNASRQRKFLKEIYEIFYDNKYFDLFAVRSLENYSKLVFDDLLNKELFEEVDEIEETSFTENTIVLTDEQEKIYKDILDSENNKHLIYGVTGSGKTEIYFSLIEDVIKRNKTAMFLVPEIGLTPQMEKRTKERFGDQVAIIHSKLSKSKRLSEIEKINSSKAKILLGTRSAIFFNLKDLDLIIIDEEHDDSYKLDRYNKYDVREVARFLIENTKGAKLVLASATPSIESYYKALHGVYDLHKILSRPNNISLPKVNIVDLKEEVKSGNTTPMSMDLMVAIKNSLFKNNQSLLFLNRRGYSSFVSCSDCGYTLNCDRCDVSMVYHKHNNFLKCHYCGKTSHMPSRCPACGSKNIKQFGLGTEKLEEFTKDLFPDLNVLRIDSDTTSSHQDYIKNMEKILAKDANIIIGTQMITKGFDYPSIQIVGVISADMSLNVPTYDSAEKTFQLLMQVSGRAGRAKSNGEVIIQTYNPDHYSIKNVSTYDYDSFYKEELKMRELFSYPPFTRHFEILLLNKDLKLGLSQARQVYLALIDELKRNKLLDQVNLVTNIDRPYIVKFNNRYHISLYLSSKIRYEKQVKNCIYEITINNSHNINLKGCHIDVLSRWFI